MLPEYQEPGLTETKVAAQAPLVRALVVQRLEMIWTTCQPHVDGTRERDGERVDPRFVEAGIRVLDRLAKLYRLDEPGHADTGVEDGGLIPMRELVLAGLLELEARMTA